MEQVARQEFESEPFCGFGPSAFWPFRRRSQTITITDDRAHVRRTMRDECPRRPGVYGMIDARGQLIYVGMSTMLPKRLVTYFQSGAEIRKEYRIASHTERLVWEVIGHGLAAQVRELELIRRHQPRFNVKGRRSGRALGYLYISREEAPRVRVARQVPRGVRYSWGPLALDWRVRDAVEAVNRQFKLRDCRSDTAMHFAEQQNLFSLDLRAECVRGETGSCLGPCAGLCTRSQYTAQLNAVRAFLDGRDLSTLTKLEEELTSTAASQQFERAATIRDKLIRLKHVAERLALLRERPLPAQFIYPVVAGRHSLWYVIAATRVVAALSVPNNADEALKCVQRLRHAYDPRTVEQLSGDRLATQILSGWFRSRPTELQSTFTPGEAIEFCQRVGPR
ncbi:MAG TPA: GIY-YIG nuclease family protein [Lacipirellulaceae bacterium]|nr:GIY-YIG nuclease family protein [Lacipirellulaceae bacterium]